VLKVLIAVVVGVAIFRIGAGMIRSLSRPLPPPPPPGEMRKVNLRYRCGVCGAELKMTLATNDLPDPPRHCMEDMDLLTPLE
jgi:hypothetical protein